MRANERTDEQVAQYFNLYSWLLSTIVHPQDLETQVKRSAPRSSNLRPFGDEDDDDRLSASSAPSGKAFLIGRLHQSLQTRQTHYGSKQGNIETLNYTPLHYGSKQGNIETLNYLSHKLESERRERESKRMSAAE